MSWYKIIIDVDYWPSDPGSTAHYCDRTEVLLKDLEAGQTIRYKDPSGLMPSVTLVGMDEKGITLKTSASTVRLPDFWGSRSAKLGEAGRDYTNFQLWATVEEAIDITHDLNFLRRFNKSYQVMSLSESDVEVLRDSDDPYAMYGYARWLVLNNRSTDDIKTAFDLYAKAAEGGCADALMGESLLWSTGIGGIVNTEIATSLRDEAVEKGSEFAALCQARHRIVGYLANKEPEKVAEEIKQRIAAETDLNPRWYSTLGFAYEGMGDKANAKLMYQEAVDRHVEEAYFYLAQIFKEEGDMETYKTLMLDGVEQGCGLCCILDADMDEGQFQAMSKDEQLQLHAKIDVRLDRGIQLGEGLCAYLLALNHYYGELGFERDFEKAFQYAYDGYRLGDASSCAFLADMQDDNTPEPYKLNEKHQAFMRLEALRFGDERQLEAVVKAYNDKFCPELLDEEEMQREWLPKYIKPLPKLVKDEMEPTVLIIHPDGYAEYMEADLKDTDTMTPFTEVAELLDAKNALVQSCSQPLRDISKSVGLEEGMQLAMFYDVDAEKKGLNVNPVATKLNGGNELRGPVVIALEGEFIEVACIDGYRNYYSFTYYDDITAVFDEIYDLVGGKLYTDDDLEDDDGRYDPYV